MTTITDTWRIQTMTGTTFGHSIIAIAPGCPDERHPTRDCACKVFRSREAAQTYINEQSQSCWADEPTHKRRNA